MELKQAPCDIYAGPKAGKLLEKLLKNARTSIRVYSPYLSPMVVKIIEKKAKHLPVEVYTVRSKGNIHHRRAVRRLRGPFQFLRRLFQGKTLRFRRLPENFHAKVFFIDDLVVLGSANLTYSGMRKNFEIITVCEDWDAVLEADRFMARNFG